MARKKKKSLVWKAAGLAARGVLKRRIVEKEQVRVAAPAKSGRGILPAQAGKPVVDTALYHALGGKDSKESLQEKAMKKALKEEGRKKALKEAAALSVAAAAVHKNKKRKRHRLVRRVLGAPLKILVLSAVVGKKKNKKK